VTDFRGNKHRALRGSTERIFAMDQSSRYIKRLSSSASAPGKVTNNTTAMNTQPTVSLVGCCSEIGRACDMAASVSLKRGSRCRSNACPAQFERGPLAEKRGAISENPAGKDYARDYCTMRWKIREAKRV
jgi:hypothetical protein